VRSGEKQRVVRGEGLITTNLLDYIFRLGPCQDFRVGNWSEPHSNKSFFTFTGHNLSADAGGCKRYAHPETRFPLATE
jgi:hypothetical protein